MSGKLTKNQTRAVKALLEHRTIEAAAQAVGIADRTLYRWLDDSVFRTALSAAEGAAIDKVTRRLITLATTALDAISDVMTHPAQRGASNKRLAAQALMDQLMKLRELRNIEQRLCTLEAAHAVNTKP